MPFKLPKQQRLLTNSFLGSLPISVLARDEIFRVIGTFLNPVCRADFELGLKSSYEISL